MHETDPADPGTSLIQLDWLPVSALTQATMQITIETKTLVLGVIRMEYFHGNLAFNTITYFESRFYSCFYEDSEMERFNSLKYILSNLSLI